MRLTKPNPPIEYCMKALTEEKSNEKNSVIHWIGRHIVNAMAQFRQEKYPSEVYCIRPREIENTMKTAIGDSRVTKTRIIRAVVSLTYGMDGDNFWWSKTRSGGRNYFIRATLDNYLFLKFRLGLI